VTHRPDSHWWSIQLSFSQGTEGRGARRCGMHSETCERSRKRPKTMHRSLSPTNLRPGYQPAPGVALASQDCFGRRGSRTLSAVNLYLTFSQYTSEQFIQHFCSRGVCGLRGAIDTAFQSDAHGLFPPSYFPSIATGKIPHAADRNEVMVIVAGVNQTIDVARRRRGRRALPTWMGVSIIPTSSRACPQLSQMTAAAKWMPARKFLAVLS